MELKKCTRHDQNLLCALIVHKGSKRAQFELAACNMSGIKIKLVDTVPVERQAYNFAEVFLFFPFFFFPYVKWK